MAESPLTETQVVDAVRVSCTQRVRDRPSCSNDGAGRDVIARKADGRLREVVVEAKDATSAQRGSARFARPFDGRQVRANVAMAFYQAALAATEDVAGVGRLAAMALPDTELHRRHTSPLRAARDRLAIGVIWVRARRGVELEAGWEL